MTIEQQSVQTTNAQDVINAGQASVTRTSMGKVVSNKMNKTIVVLIERKVKHPLYGKYVKRFSKMVAHDEENACREGDLVLIQQTRPISKTKCWKLVEILEKADQDNIAGK
jgi:small subunit ribosomal protein S17